jgi:hypothetical protein
MKKFALGFLILCFSFSLFADVSRWIDMEWEEVPGAKGYEVELFQDVKGTKLTRGKFKLDESRWSHAVSPGQYSLRIRSLDPRGVPGEWSDYVPLKVRLENPQLLLPVPGAKVEKPEVQFEWSEITGAKTYQLVILNPSGSILLNTNLQENKYSFPLRSLGKYEWMVFALEENEGTRAQEIWPRKSFRSFERVGGELDAPFVNLTLNNKVNLTWQKSPFAQVYEIDYLPPAGKDKNRRFKLKRLNLRLDPRRLKEGATTFTVKATAPGYEDSLKSMVVLRKTGERVEIEDIIQGQRDEVEKNPPTKSHFRDQLLVSLALARFDYESTDTDSDTFLDQEKLTGLGINAEWLRQKKYNSLIHKVDFSAINLSTGLESGIMSHLGYTFNWNRNHSGRKWMYGAGLSVLSLPSFMGDRIRDEVRVEKSTTAGLALNLGYAHPLSGRKLIRADLGVDIHPWYLSSERDGGKTVIWLKAQLRYFQYITRTQALFGGIEYQRWEEEWGRDRSKVGGLSFVLGMNFGYE